MSTPKPTDDPLARLPVELTDAIIDYLDRPSLVHASMIAKSWRVRALIQLYRRLEVWSGGSATCERSRLPRRSCVQISSAAFTELLARDEARFRPVRELHLVFAGSRLSSDALREMDLFLNSVRRLPFCELEHLGMYSFPSSVSQPLNELMALSTNLRSLHIVDFNTVDVDILLFHARRFPCIRTLAVLQGSSGSSIDVNIIDFTPTTHRADRDYIVPDNCQVFLAPNTMVDLLTWIAHAPQTGRTLNIVGVRAFTFGRGLEELLAAHPPFQLDDTMSCIRSLEIVIDYEGRCQYYAPTLQPLIRGSDATPDKYHRLVQLLQAFCHVPVLQLTFEVDCANLELIARLLQETSIDWSFLQHIIFDLRSPQPLRLPQWDLIDTTLATESQHQSSLQSVIISLRDARPSDADCLAYLPQLRERGMVRVVRRELDTTQSRFLPSIADDSIARMI